MVIIIYLFFFPEMKMYCYLAFWLQEPARWWLGNTAEREKKKRQKRRPVHGLFASGNVLCEKTLLLENTWWEYFQNIFHSFPMTWH